MSGPQGFRPPAPVAKRLYRNALFLACGVLGITVLVAMSLVSPRQDQEQPIAVQVVAGPPGPAKATFLDRPVAVPDSNSLPGNGRGEGPARVVRARSPDDWSPARERAYRAALTSAAVIQRPEKAQSQPASGDTSSLSAEEQRLVSVGDSVLRTSGGGPAAPGRADRRGFLADVGFSRGSRVNAVIEPASPFTLRAGTVMPALLLTGVNSDLPGDVLGQVSRDVFDSKTERVLLVPKGSRLVGTYDNRVVAGENRLLVAWTRLIFPDGRSLKLPGLALTDRTGQSGIQGNVDTHWGRVFGKALLLSAIGAGAELSQPPATAFAAPSAGQVAAGAVGQELSSVALELIRRGMDAPPTITVLQGEAFNVFLNGDLVLDGPYGDEDP